MAPLADRMFHQVLLAAAGAGEREAGGMGMGDLSWLGLLL